MGPCGVQGTPANTQDAAMPRDVVHVTWVEVRYGEQGCYTTTTPRTRVYCAPPADANGKESKASASKESLSLPLEQPCVAIDRSSSSTCKKLNTEKLTFNFYGAPQSRNFNF